MAYLNMAARCRMWDAASIRACEMANSDEDLRAIAREFRLDTERHRGAVDD